MATAVVLVSCTLGNVAVGAVPSPPARVAEDDPASTAVEVRRVWDRLQVIRRRAETRQAAAAVVADARDDPSVVAADVDSPVTASGAVEVPESQWALRRLDAATIWGRHRADGQVIAVVDSGVDHMHRDLAAVTLPGVDLVEPDGDGRHDPNGHGTSVAGLAAAVGGDGFGVSGLAQGASILPVRVLDETGAGYASDVVDGILWAVDNGADVVTLSLTGTDSAELYDAAVTYAEAHDVVVVAAAGNRGLAAPTTYPAAHVDVVGVAATTEFDARWTWSSTGDWVTVAAPGASVLSTVPGGGHASVSGTSMAAAYVAATAALVGANEPAFSAEQRRQRLRATAVDLGDTGWDEEFGDGLISPVAAVGPGAGPSHRWLRHPWARLPWRWLWS